MLQEIIQTVELSGKGETKKSAVASALNKIQSKILKDSEDAILRIEPLEIKSITISKKVTREKFLFIFFPRDKEEYYVDLVISVKIIKINISDIKVEN
ncbi:conserved hypothetical protein EF_0831/AHA_3912 [Granulicatella balaenopterae]|uniref:Cytoplasmic protein n=1 Tax=Granulicatella balaenopterae TaxID=137733 RepID=A0A1H9NXV1_9LACT|nr:DUF4312 family protein [Granulicatella balaenopterae]SER40163.1 conserved hypothetical protein EF_0831/AHA_3912 [Granulicatella balaenopterae]